MPSHEELINELCGLCGIIPEYWDIFGNIHTVSIETQKAILGAMRLNIESDEDIQKEIAGLRARPWTGFIEPVMIVSINNQPPAIPIHIQIEEGKENELSISWSIENEDGQKKNLQSKGTP